MGKSSKLLLAKMYRISIHLIIGYLDINIFCIHIFVICFSGFHSTWWNEKGNDHFTCVYQFGIWKKNQENELVELSNNVWMRLRIYQLTNIRCFSCRFNEHMKQNQDRTRFSTYESNNHRVQWNVNKIESLEWYLINEKPIFEWNSTINIT